MKAMSIKVMSVAVLMSSFALSACSPEVGSDKWCAKLKDKPKGDWTQTETKDYAKNCLF